ncbi:MAG: homocysteine S-methyltransferase family protein [Clostridia bacterium]|nr:homocysteine S-methyltransferase family protein [Clostridia bacterium]
MNIIKYMKDHLLFLDGGMGTLLQERGMKPGELPERRSLSHPEDVRAIHAAYFEAGSNLVNTNTFGANSLKYSEEELEEIIAASIACARDAAAGAEHRWVALDIGPTGRVLKPYGDLDFEDAVALYRRVASLGAAHGADLIYIETMTDLYELKAAMLGVKEACSLPFFASLAFGEDGRLMTGADPLAALALAEGMGASAVGVNCSLGPRALYPVLNKLTENASIPVLFKPNAGLPHMKDGRAVFDLSCEEFATEVEAAIAMGVSAVGGCCGTTPDYIRALYERLGECKPQRKEVRKQTVVASGRGSVAFAERPILIGERINPTGKRRFKEALLNNDISYILAEGIREEECGADILDVNVGLPGIDEPSMLKRVTEELQAVVDTPLELDTSSPEAMEAALRTYNGKALINSVNGKRESLDAILPLCKKYGGVLIALTLDEEGIPESAEGRLAIAERILAEAEKYGIGKEDIIFDPLALTVSADKNAARETLRAVRLIRERLGCHTSLGISNVSFGLPARDALNSTFFISALREGLSAAIVNPFSDALMGAYHAYLALLGMDENFRGYIAYSEAHQVSESEKNAIKPDTGATEAQSVGKSSDPATDRGKASVAGGCESELERAIVKGLRQDAARLTEEELKSLSPLDVVSERIVPALNSVGSAYEAGRVYLPGLLMSAEAAKAAFEVVSSAMPKGDGRGRMPIVIATVKGDIHDIGKNIVKVLCENYGFRVSDLGKDVCPEAILEEARRTSAPLVALSALMTTTVPAMEKTVSLIHKELPGVRVIVGGAVMTEEHAKMIGADAYSKDAMGAVRYAEWLEKELGM